MQQDAHPTDISAMPDVIRLAREVARTGTERLLAENGTVVARIVPPRRRWRTAKVTTREALLQVLTETHGAWTGLIDPDEFMRERDRLQAHERDPRTL